LQRASTVRRAIFRSVFLTLANTCSMGSMSGLSRLFLRFALCLAGGRYVGSFLLPCLRAPPGSAAYRLPQRRKPLHQLNDAARADPENSRLVTRPACTAPTIRSRKSRRRFFMGERFSRGRSWALMNVGSSDSPVFSVEYAPKYLHVDLLSTAVRVRAYSVAGAFWSERSGLSR
jgi:hypothetical protein